MGLPYRGKLFLLGRNALAALRNKYVGFELIIIDKISMVTKNMFDEMYCRLIENFSWTNLIFAGRSILVAGDFYQTFINFPEYQHMPVAYMQITQKVILQTIYEECLVF